jgi:single-strand DNA-binding protein
MANFNKVILAGNLTRDPQLRYLPNQTPVVDFGLAINRKWTSPDGQRKEDTCFVDCSAFGKPAETINHYLKKGQPILVEGRLTFQQWQAQDGTKRSKLSVTVETFQFLGGPPAGGGSDANGGGGARPPMRTTRPPQQAATAEEGPPPDAAPMPDEEVGQAPHKEDDIPF